MAELFRSPNISIDTFYQMIVQEDILVDLKEVDLSKANQIYVHRTADGAFLTEAADHNKLSIPQPVLVAAGEEIIWCGREWRIIADLGSNIVLLDDLGKTFKINRDEFHNLIGKEEIRGLTKSEYNDNGFFRDKILYAAKEQFGIALERYELIKGLLNNNEYPSEISVTPRTLRNWVKRYKKADILCGNGFVGLIPDTHNKGNKTSKIPDPTKELIKKFVSNNFEEPIGKNRILVYGELVNECEKAGVQAPSYKTFCEYVKKRPVYEKELSRKGRRAAYNSEEFYYGYEYTTPRHGSRPYEICHIDHTELDIELINPENGENLGRPWLTIMIDAFTRSLLAYSIVYEPPSYRSCMLIIRECVKKHGRMPENIVIDNGKEFHSIYFQSLCATYKSTLIYRPPAQSRFGSVCERAFGTTNTQFVHNLIGNTKITKNIRQVTKSNDPKRLAIYSLKDITEMMEHWSSEVYQCQYHPALNQSPEEALANAIQISGNHPHRIIPYNQDFIIMTMPSTRKGSAKVSSNRGIQVNCLSYWNNAFREGGVDGSSVPVRYDPYCMGVAWAYVCKKWRECQSEYFNIFKDLTERELKIAAAEIRKKNTDYSRSKSINAKQLAQFFANNSNGDLAKDKAKARENLKLIKNYSEPKYDDIAECGFQKTIDKSVLPHFEEY